MFGMNIVVTAGAVIKNINYVVNLHMGKVGQPLESRISIMSGVIVLIDEGRWEGRKIVGQVIT